MSGQILNEELKWEEVDIPSVRSKFSGLYATRQLFTPGNNEFYKLTSWGLYRCNPATGKNEVTPWWSLVKPLDPNDPGLAGTQERARQLSVSLGQFTGARAAVTGAAQGGNELTGTLRMRLREPVYGFYGRCSGQRIDDDPACANVFFIGGAFQVWIPNLTDQQTVQVGS